MLGALFSLIGFAALALWAAFVFGWPAALLAGGIECLVIGLAVSDVRTPLTARREDEDA